MQSIINSIEDQPIEVLNLSSSVYHALVRAEITTVRQLEQLSLNELRSIRNIGKKGLQELEACCKAHQLLLSQSPIDQFLNSSLKARLSHKTLMLLHQAKIKNMEELFSSSTEELFIWCGQDIHKTLKIFKELESAGIQLLPASPPFLFECIQLSAVIFHCLFWHQIYRIDQLMALSEESLKNLRNLGPKRVQEILLQKEKYSFQTEMASKEDFPF